MLQRLAVGDQLVLPIVRILAARYRALVWLMTNMSSYVVVSVSDHGEVFAAEVTMVGLAPGMDAPVNLKYHNNKVR